MAADRRPRRRRCPDVARARGSRTAATRDLGRGDGRGGRLGRPLAGRAGPRRGGLAERVLRAHRRYLGFPPPDMLVEPEDLSTLERHHEATGDPGRAPVRRGTGPRGCPRRASPRQHRLPRLRHRPAPATPRTTVPGGRSGQTRHGTRPGLASRHPGTCARSGVSAPFTSTQQPYSLPAGRRRQAVRDHDELAARRREQERAGGRQCRRRSRRARRGSRPVRCSIRMVVSVTVDRTAISLSWLSVPGASDDAGGREPQDAGDDDGRGEPGDDGEAAAAAPGDRDADGARGGARGYRRPGASLDGTSDRSRPTAAHERQRPLPERRIRQRLDRLPRDRRRYAGSAPALPCSPGSRPGARRRRLRRACRPPSAARARPARPRRSRCAPARQRVPWSSIWSAAAGPRRPRVLRFEHGPQPGESPTRPRLHRAERPGEPLGDL